MEIHVDEQASLDLANRVSAISSISSFGLMFSSGPVLSSRLGRR